MGIRRLDRENQEKLREGLKFAVAIEASGEEFTDYHTALPPAKGESFLKTRREELSWGTGDAVVTRRDYRVDSLHTVCLWNVESQKGPTLEEVKEALLFPVFTPYLGRKSCPPCLPFSPEIVETKDLKQAFYQYWKRRPQIGIVRKLKGGSHITIYWEKPHPQPGMEIEGVDQRKDQPLNRKNWTFRKRSENKSVIKSE